MSEVEKEARWQDNKEVLQDEALALYIRGHSSRSARRVLMQKHVLVPGSRTLRDWAEKYSDQIKEAVSKGGEMKVLEALEAEGDYVEDVSDDILRYAVPSLMGDLKEGKFDALPLKDKLDTVTKELKEKSRRTEVKIMRLDPHANAQAPPFIVALLRQSTEPLGVQDGSPGTGIIDAQVTHVQQVADLPAIRLPAQGGDTTRDSRE